MKMRITTTSLTALAALATLAGANTASAALAATAEMSTSEVSAPFNYTITLHNTGTSNIGTFWFAWTPAPASYDFLPTAPTNISGPASWVAPITHNGFPGDGYGIEWYNLGGSFITPGTDGVFHFTSNDSPAVLAGNAFFPGFKITDSFIYAGLPQNGPTFRLPVTITPAPGTALAFLGLAGLRRRRA